MTDKELTKKAEESYAKKLKDSSYYETSEEGAYICGYIAGTKEIENEYMLKLKDTSLVRVLKDSIIMNEKLSSQEQQELCAWIEAAIEFGENLDKCAKENEQLKAQIEKMKCCWNCKHPAKDSTGCCCPFAASCHNRSLWEMDENQRSEKE